MKLTIQSLGFLIGFQEYIKIPRPRGTINHTVITVSYRVSRRYHHRHHRRRRRRHRHRRRHHRHRHRHLGLPGRSLRDNSSSINNSNNIHSNNNSYNNIIK